MGIFLGGQERRGFFPEPPVPSFYGADMSGGSSTNMNRRPDLALTVPAVWACVNLMAGTVSSLPLETFRRTNDTPVSVKSPQVVAEPSAGQTQSQWLHMLMMSMLLRGNVYGRIAARDSMERPTQIDLLSPDDLDVKMDTDTGDLVYKVRKTQTVIPPGNVWHVPGMTMPGRKIGLSPVSYAAATLGIDLSARRFGEDFLEGGGIPKGVLQSDQKVDQEQARTIKARLMAATRSREPIVLGMGLQYKTISVAAEESQFLATLQANVAQVARFFGVPPEMVGGSSGNSMTYANVEQRSLDFLTYGLAPWLKRIEDAVSALLPTPQYVKFRISELLRTDAHTQATVDGIRIASKVQTPTEVRDTLNLPPMTDAQRVEADLVPQVVGVTGAAKALPALKELPGPVAATPANDVQGDPNV